jgi:hypothetical protein
MRDIFDDLSRSRKSRRNDPGVEGDFIPGCSGCQVVFTFGVSHQLEVRYAPGISSHRQGRQQYFCCQCDVGSIIFQAG